MHSDSTTTPLRALVIIPGTVNYFYNLSGERIAEALRELGFAVEIRTLPECVEDDYDWCLLSSITEILHAYGDEGAGLARLETLRGRYRSMASLTLECVSTPWHHRIRELSTRAGADLILDLGLYDQGEFLDPADRSGYRFVFSGLTRSERRQLDDLDEEYASRTIPWAFVGQVTPERAALVDHLIQKVDPRGFVYMPGTAPYTEKGSPHLNQQQFERVLRQTRYQIWCSHHSYFYMETERFRTSLLTGGVPIKIVESRSAIPRSAPLDYLILEPGEVEGRLTDDLFLRLRSRFRQDWRGFPALSAGIGRVLAQAGLIAISRPSRAA
jgi:hypothetical protein